MGWGHYLKEAWQNATAPAKQAATSILNGANFVSSAVENSAAKAYKEVKSSAVSTTRKIARFARKKITQAFDIAKKTFGAVQSFVSCVPDIWRTEEELDAKYPDRKFDGALIGRDCTRLDWKGDQLDSAILDSFKQKGYKSQGCHPGNPKQRTIYFVNGIANELKSGLCESLNAITKEVGAADPDTCITVVGVYNATEGWARDLLQAGYDWELIRNANSGHAPPVYDGRNPAVDTMTQVMVSESLSKNDIEIWGHSQGTAIVSLATYDASNELKLSNFLDGTDVSLRGVTVELFANIGRGTAAGCKSVRKWRNPLDAVPYAGSNSNAVSVDGPLLGHNFAGVYLPEYVSKTSSTGVAAGR